MLNRRQLLGAAGAMGIGLAATACSTGGKPAASGAPSAGGELKGVINIVTPEFAGTDGKAAFEGKILN